MWINLTLPIGPLFNLMKINFILIYCVGEKFSFIKSHMEALKALKKFPFKNVRKGKVEKFHFDNLKSQKTLLKLSRDWNIEKS